jgi:hypothetical protein
MNNFPGMQNVLGTERLKLGGVQFVEKTQSKLDRSLQQFDGCIERASKILGQLNIAADRLAGAEPEQLNDSCKDFCANGVAYEIEARCARLREILDGFERATQRLTEI